MFFTEITVDEMQQWQTTNKPFQLIDVRSAEEIKQAAIPDALGIPLTTLPMRHQEIDKDRPIICYCHSGGRSAQACMFLQQQGFTNLYNLRGGIAAWAMKGLPLSASQVS